jgi:hypothetical protein
MSILRMSRAEIGGEIIGAGRGAADCGEYRQAAGAVAAQVNVTGGGQLLVY